MLDYALHFYNSYTIIFYILLVITVILEGPITILTLSLLAPKFGFSFGLLLLFSFLGEFFGDLLHYFIGRFFKKNIFQERNFALFEKIEKKLERHSLLDKLIVIKYTPPITSIGLLYMGFQKINLKKFMKNVSIFSLVNGLLVTSIGFNFGRFFVNKDELEYILIGLMVSFLLVYFLIKLISSYFIKKVLNEK